MKKTLLLLLILLGIKELKGQCDICGTYIGKSEQRFQELIIKKDSTFEYNYNDNWATLIGATTEGIWEIVGNEIELNSEFNDEEYEITTKCIDLCETAPTYLIDSCEKLIKIQIVNLDDKYIWHLNSVMINNDASQISTISYEDFNNLDKLETTSCFFISDSINKINIYNGFYDKFVLSISEPKTNYVKIKGNFADVNWYTYFKDERWRIRKNKLTKNKKFGKFIKK